MSSFVVWIFGVVYNIAIAILEQKLFCDYNILYPHIHENEIRKTRNTKNKNGDNIMVIEIAHLIFGSCNSVGNYMMRESWSSNAYLKF